MPSAWSRQRVARRQHRTGASRADDRSARTGRCGKWKHDRPAVGKRLFQRRCRWVEIQSLSGPLLATGRDDRADHGLDRWRREHVAGCCRHVPTPSPGRPVAAEHEYRPAEELGQLPTCSSGPPHWAISTLDTRQLLDTESNSLRIRRLDWEHLSRGIPCGLHQLRRSISSRVPGCSNHGVQTALLVSSGASAGSRNRPV